MTELWLYLPDYWSERRCAEAMALLCGTYHTLHLPYNWRDAMTPDEWVAAIGGFPTMSPFRDDQGHMLTKDGQLVLNFRKFRPVSGR